MTLKSEAQVARGAALEPGRASPKSRRADRAALAPPPSQPAPPAALVDHVPEGNRWLHALKVAGWGRAGQTLPDL
jgi:bifunctional non-homologous end joining protein LigD